MAQTIVASAEIPDGEGVVQDQMEIPRFFDKLVAAVQSSVSPEFRVNGNRLEMLVDSDYYEGKGDKLSVLPPEQRVVIDPSLTDNYERWVEWGELIGELREHPRMRAEIHRWRITLISPDPRDLFGQHHHPTFSRAATEECYRNYEDEEYHVTWVLG